MATIAKNDPDTYGFSMKGPVLTSAVFHVIVFIVAAVGLPFIVPDQMDVTPPVSVDIVTIDDITKTDRAPKPDKPTEKPKEPEKPEPAPSMAAETPPDLTKQTPPKKTVEAEKPPEPDPVPVPEKIEKPPEAKPKKPDPKPKPKEEPKKEEPAAADFSSLLKNLTPDVAEAETQASPEPAPNVLFTGRLTISEMDAFKRQIEPCWNVPSGVKYAEDLAVEIRLHMNVDGSVRQADVLDRGRYMRDGAFRAAADSAMRAVYNPRCAPFRLPAEKYQLWKTVVINFNPRDML